MWDWSIKARGRMIPEKKQETEFLCQNTFPTENSLSPEHKNFCLLSDEECLQEVQKLLQKYKLWDLQLKKQYYAPKTMEEMSLIFSDYQKKRTSFIKLCGHLLKENKSLTEISEEDIETLQKGIVPENYNTHLKIPFDFGGNTEFENFSLIKTHHTHSDIHRIIDFQISKGILQQRKFIYLPFFEGKFYDAPHF